MLLEAGLAFCPGCTPGVPLTSPLEKCDPTEIGCSHLRAVCPEGWARSGLLPRQIHFLWHTIENVKKISTTHEKSLYIYYHHAPALLNKVSGEIPVLPVVCPA